MRIVYIADDGTQFDDEWDCRDYEFRKTLDLCDIEVYDENGLRLMDVFDEDAYNKAVKVVAKTEKAVSDLHKIVDYTGFVVYGDIDSPGTWIFEDNKEGRYGAFVQRK